MTFEAWIQGAPTAPNPETIVLTPCVQFNRRTDGVYVQYWPACEGVGAGYEGTLSASQNNRHLSAKVRLLVNHLVKQYRDWEAEV